MIGYIYKTTNLINGKIYIGQHKVDSNIFDNNYFGSGKLLLEAIKKYGKENFKCELIEWCKSEDELNKKEIYYIAAYKSLVTYNNYNISDGGYVPRLSGNLNGNYGKHRPHTEKEKKHLSEVTKGHKPTFTGPHSEAYKQYMSKLTSKNNLERYKSTDIYKKVSDSAKGNKMMNKDGKCVRVHPEDFDKYLFEGWIFGGLPRVGKYKNRKQVTPKTFTTKDTVGINNGILNKFIPKDQLEKYLNDGWSKGLKKRD